ncbi:hypothetical protein TWF694_007563 [Orbilia ellipsospora]|uniref:F-box domain-containing protein n=1 Tax=Orbilia ellipsospora TaxID=2528407 RepID=A0AAV9XI44_9PEZI
MAADESKSGMDGLDGFPNEVLALILELLDLDSLFRCHDVCKSWRKCSLWESNYLPHVFDAYTELTHGTRPLSATLSGSEKTQLLGELFRTSVSALPVFATCRSLRDIAVVLRRLDRAWLAGNNTSFASLSHVNVQTPALCMAVDTETGSIVTGHSEGIVAFWNASEKSCYYQSSFETFGYRRVIPKQIAIEGNIMVIASNNGGIVVTRRSRTGRNPPFIQVGEFRVATQATSICMEKYVCIVGENSAVSFWDLSRFAKYEPLPAGTNPSQLLMTIDTSNDNLPVPNSPVNSLFYRDSQLYLGLAGSRIQQIISQSSRGRIFKRQLWEPEEDPYTRLALGPEYHGSSMGQSRLCPMGSKGDILVSWADSSIYRLSPNIGDDLVWEPRYECLVPAVKSSCKDCVGIYARGEQVICRVRQNEIELFLGNGALIRRIPHAHGDISCILFDPAFIAVGTKEASLCVYYFAPWHKICANGQGPSPPAATNSLQSALSERKHTYKRKYQDAMGMDLDKSSVVGAVVGSNAGLRVPTKNTLRGSSPRRLALESSTGIKIPVPAP